RETESGMRSSSSGESREQSLHLQEPAASACTNIFTTPSPGSAYGFRKQDYQNHQKSHRLSLREGKATEVSLGFHCT
ncbi:hypothetical protein QQF64_002372, partial [Cirrhinus molitorella]